MPAPFEVLTCFWPRPVACEDGRWASEPEWDAPPMPFTPTPRWCLQGGEPCLMIDWREFFRGVKDYSHSAGISMNLHRTRHEEGRTYGSKGTATKAEAVGKIQDVASQWKLPADVKSRVKCGSSKLESKNASAWPDLLG